MPIGDNVRCVILNTNRSWMRDSGPVVVQRGDGTREALQFRFNGWAKYPNHRLDARIPPAVAAALQLPLTRVLRDGKPVVLEGGAIDVNGSGTLITTEECLLDAGVQVRNPGFYEAGLRIRLRRVPRRPQRDLARPRASTATTPTATSTTSAVL